jgi:membrane associated rhomboid family serine protease
MAYLADPDPEAFNLFVVQHASQYYESLISFIDAYVENPNNPEYISQSRVFVQDLMGRIENVPMVGASGAVFGILMAFGMLFPNTQLFLLFPPIPIKAKYLVFFYGAYELYSELNRSQGDNVAHLAHLGGMLIAFIVIKYWQKNSSKFY